jgi:hypothetical protein
MRRLHPANSYDAAVHSDGRRAPSAARCLCNPLSARPESSHKYSLPAHSSNVRICRRPRGWAVLVRGWKGGQIANAWVTARQVDGALQCRTVASIPSSRMAVSLSSFRVVRAGARRRAVGPWYAARALLGVIHSRGSGFWSFWASRSMWDRGANGSERTLRMPHKPDWGRAM